MTEEEIAQLLVDLEELLSGLNLDFIVAQERVTAAEGVTKLGGEFGRSGEADLFRSQFTPMETLAPEVDDLFQSERIISRKQRPKRDDVFVAPLDNRARLSLLLDLIEVATAGTLAMERYVHDELAELRELTHSGSESEAESTVETAQLERGEVWDGSVTFADPPEAELRRSSQQPWTIAINSTFSEKGARARNVVGLIDALRAQAGVSRGVWLAQGFSNNLDDGLPPSKGAR